MKNGVSLSNRFLFNPQRVGLGASWLLASLHASIFPLVLPFQAIPLFPRFQGSLSLSLSLMVIIIEGELRC